MNGDQILTLLVAVIGAVGASLATGFISRPKTIADAGAAQAGGQVAISGDARAWAQQFAEQAVAANTRAEASDARARLAADKADAVSIRVDELESVMTVFASYCRTLQREVVSLGGHPPAPPDALIPPL